MSSYWAWSLATYLSLTRLLICNRYISNIIYVVLKITNKNGIFIHVFGGDRIACDHTFFSNENITSKNKSHWNGFISMDKNSDGNMWPWLEAIGKSACENRNKIYMLSVLLILYIRRNHNHTYNSRWKYDGYTWATFGCMLSMLPVLHLLL